MKPLKLKFSKDTFYNGELMFEKDVVYDVPVENGWAMRWLKRGAVEVFEEPVELTEKLLTPETPVETKKEEVQTEVTETAVTEVEKELEKDETEPARGPKRAGKKNPSKDSSKEL